MTFAQARNAIVSGLEAHIGCPVNLSEQIRRYARNTHTAITAFSLREYRSIRSACGRLLKLPTGRCSSVPNRCRLLCRSPFAARIGKPRDGYIFGEDEALELAEKANGFFLLNAHNIQTEQGEVVIVNVGSVASRSSFFVEDTIRRYGFDIRFSMYEPTRCPLLLWSVRETP